MKKEKLIDIPFIIKSIIICFALFGFFNFLYSSNSTSILPLLRPNIGDIEY